MRHQSAERGSFLKYISDELVGGHLLLMNPSGTAHTQRGIRLMYIWRRSVGGWRLQTLSSTTRETAHRSRIGFILHAAKRACLLSDSHRQNQASHCERKNKTNGSEICSRLVFFDDFIHIVPKINSNKAPIRSYLITENEEQNMQRLKENETTVCQHPVFHWG